MEPWFALTGLLTSAGYRVRLFESAERFLEAQDAETPGCLLTEAVLPGMNGLELQRVLIAGSDLWTGTQLIGDRPSSQWGANGPFGANGEESVNGRMWPPIAEVY